MKKEMLLIIIVLFLLIVGYIVYNEQKSSDSNVNIVQNQLPVPIITELDYTPWWNDTINIYSYGSYDPDGDIIEYIWWLNCDKYGWYTDENYNFAQSKTGEDVEFKLPESVHVTDNNSIITLAVVDDKGAIQFSHYYFDIIAPPRLFLKQINSTPLIEITGVTSEKININEVCQKMFGGSSHISDYIDTDEDGYVSEGDIINISNNYEYKSGISGSTVEFTLLGCYPHNQKTVLSSIDAKVE